MIGIMDREDQEDPAAVFLSGYWAESPMGGCHEVIREGLAGASAEYFHFQLNQILRCTPERETERVEQTPGCR